MIRSHDCDTIREMVFNYRRGELSELDAALFEESLIECDECATYVGRIIDMLDVSIEAEAQDYIDRPIDASFADSLFDAIAAEIESPSSEDHDDDDEDDGDHDHAQSDEEAELRPPVRLEFVTEQRDEEAIDDELFDFDEDAEQAASTWPKWLAVAAVILGVGIGALMTRPWEKASVEDAPDGLAEDTTAPVSATPDAALAKAFQQLQPQGKANDTIKVFASSGAKWKLEGASPDHRLRLERGTVLVEFLPENDNEKLRVISGETEVAVLGTVFYVSAEEPGQDKPARVGVITGKVSVKQPAPGKEAPVEVMLEDGQENNGGEEVREIQPTMKQQTEAFVDIKAHQKALAERTDPPEEHAKADVKPLPPKETKPEKAEEVVVAAPARKTSSDAALRKQAQKALRERDYARAAKTYERLLERLPRGHNERASIRLELARLYMRYLGQRERAIEHLREFVEQHPLDVAAPSARRQLCQLLGMRASKDPACISLQMD